MGFFSFNPMELLGGGGGGGSSSFSGGGAFNKESTSSSNSNSNNVTTTTTNDNSATINTDARDYSTTTTSNTLSSWLDQSITETTDARQWIDQSQRTTIDVRDSSARDFSQRTYTDNAQTTITNANGTEVASLAAGLLRDLGGQQTEAQKAMAKLGADGIAAQADAARGMFTTASTEAGKAWGHVVDKSAEALDKLMQNAREAIGQSLSTAQTIGTASVQANPMASDGQSVRVALIGAAAVLLAALLSKR